MYEIGSQTRTPTWVARPIRQTRFETRGYHKRGWQVGERWTKADEERRVENTQRGLQWNGCQQRLTSVWGTPKKAWWQKCGAARAHSVATNTPVNLPRRTKSPGRMRDTRDFEQWQQPVGTPTPPSSPRAALPTRIFAAPPPVMLPVGVSGAPLPTSPPDHAARTLEPPVVPVQLPVIRKYLTSLNFWNVY